MRALERNQEPLGLVFNIQQYSIHDGPGIRTVVFLKGCPLRCRWCANPESQLSCPQLSWIEKDCIACQSCVNCLPELHCRFEPDGLYWEETDLLDTDTIRKACPTQALHQIGEWKTVSQVLEQVEKDSVFYGNSGGGMTLSGGEPLMQAEFTEQLLERAGERHIHRAMETTGYVDWEVLERIAKHLDYLLYDVKTFREDLHRSQTGVSNQQILENLRRVRREFPSLPIRVRTPVIPGVNDSEEEIIAITAFLRTIPNLEYELLKYHRFGEAKYKTLHRSNPMGDVDLSEERFRELEKAAVYNFYK